MAGLLLPAIIMVLFVAPTNGYAQLSPGDLTEVHAHLEGLSNCTACHTLGQKVSNDNCLACHTLLQERINNQKGYHVSKEIAGKECVSCHSDHHGRKFEIIRFDKNSFDHTLTGYELLGAHKKQDCEKCHKTDFITNEEVKKKKSTFMGLQTNCLACHADQHQNTLSKDCLSCHDFNAFKPVSKFDHNKAKFRLLGKHQDLDCIKCHKKSTVDGKHFQQFTGIAFESCTSCHLDIHNNKFGQNCTQCHNEQSFHTVKGMADFDHNRTRFKLEARHQTLECKACHKTKLTDPIRHSRCTDCHADYHERQFVKAGKAPDCIDCHSVKGFTASSFGIERHRNTEFPLKGAHLATPCFVCHKKGDEKWNFKMKGTKCTSCHENIHEAYIDKKYYPENRCESCHTENRWAEVTFDHAKTSYELSGAHSKQSCRACHFKLEADGSSRQQFKSLTSACTDCHQEIHNGQFEKEGKTDCLRCHDNSKWKIPAFDHNKTRFPLDGKHKNVACAACHKKKFVGQTTYVQYKFNEIRCENCH